MLANKYLDLTKKFVIILFIFKLIECLLPTGHGDALYYHLVLGKAWLESGLDFAYKNVCGAITTGLLDHLYVIPQYLLGSKIEAHVISQFMHFTFSVIFCCLICLKYFKKNIFAYLGCIAFLTINHSPDFLIYPKNDGLVGSLALFTALIILDENWLLEKNSNKRPALIGILLGLLTLIKLSSLTIVGPLALFYAYQKRKDFNSLVQVILISSFLFSIILIRNQIYMGNPLYPGFTSIFPGKLSPEMIQIQSNFMSNPLRWSTFLRSLKAFFTPKSAILLLPLLFMLKKIQRPNSLALKLYGISTVSFIIYLATNGGIYSPRFIFPVLFINLFASLLWLSRFQLSPQKLAIIIALLMVDSKIDKIIMRDLKVLNYYPITNSQQQMNLISPRSALFNPIRDFKNSKIISDDFNEIYYAPKGTILHGIECQPQSNFIVKCDSLEDLKKLKSYDFAILKEKKSNPCYDFIQMNPPLSQVDIYRLYKI